MTTRAQTRPAERSAQIDFIARNLLSRAALLVRLLVKQVPTGDVSRTEVEVLAVLGEGPRRITELAELEGLAQPTMTVLVRRLEERGWVSRAGHPDDGRVVLVAITARGRKAVEAFRAEFLAALRSDLEGLSARELAALSRATQSLGSFVEELQRET
ncbi:MAG TPA: MarR family transcriptional regulator [Solirubrobacteraceae bacterium]|nr:MarR family transcriptional regulator [Solirubrobacteraceae bacterium]